MLTSINSTQKPVLSMNERYLILRGNYLKVCKVLVDSHATLSDRVCFWFSDVAIFCTVTCNLSVCSVW